jgi:FMN-dependent NADH-azoreductase
MKTLLQINSSGRTARSRTRHLTEWFVSRWRDWRPLDPILTRDVGSHPPPPVDEAWIAAAFTPPDQRTPAHRSALRLSELLIDELFRADFIVLGAPMYNFGMPAQLKAYVDQVVRVGRTFAFDPTNAGQPYRPLLAPGKKMVVITSSGDTGFEPGGPMAHWNHLDPHLQTAFGFIGITDLTFIRVAYDEFADDRVAQSVAAAEQVLEGLAWQWAHERPAGCVVAQV